MLRRLRIAILPLVAVLMPIPHGNADGLSIQPFKSVKRPLILVQQGNRELCAQRCEFDYQTCAQIVRENSSNGNYGGYQLIPQQRAQEFNQYALDGCETKFRYCNRNCDRP
jgi:hypothetical protein